ncbi:hypothetical protein ACVBEQ_10895 [Nakamurella sp. GG22]
MRLPHISELLGDELADVVDHSLLSRRSFRDPEVAAVIDGLDLDLLLLNLVHLHDSKSPQQRPRYRRME